MTDIKITRAKLIPMNGENVVTDVTQQIEVQFNPATLRVTLSNSLKADNRGGSGGSRNAAQFVEKSESSLTVELLFDTTVSHTELQHQINQNEAGVSRVGAESGSTEIKANSDVRKLTRRIAEQFMQPQEPNSARPKAPKRCRLQWGSFQFTGMISSYSETLDFFAPEGIPLRATLALTLKEDRYQFAMDEETTAATRATPGFTPGGPGVSAAQANQNAGKNPRDWRSLANANDLENPRTTPESGVSVPASRTQSGGR